MKIDLGTKLCGFTVVRARESKSIGGTLYEMVHEKSGAQLCYADNGLENKTFSIAFKTVPENSTGVFHILEHSVLCGSEKYPVKDPFLELMKSSMNTFLNAMTYSDKTVYPVSSRNEQDFLNLTSVYLDAVFAPNLLQNPNIFRQEGWRLDRDEDGKLYYNGVVLNEMKGAMSDVNDLIEYNLISLLFPDSCYRFNSGGDPASITDLTFEQFTETYRRFYHPSNARFFLDGSVPLEKTLGMIDCYLSKFDNRKIDPEITEQKPCSAEAVSYYESDGSTGDRDIISFGKIIGRYDDVLTVTVAHILAHYLASTNESPLKKAILSEKLAENVDLVVSDGILQPYVVLVLRNTRSSEKERIKKLVNDTLASIIKEGIPKEELVAELNKLEFSYRQTPEPQGLHHAVGALSSWLYGGDPLLLVDYDEVFVQLRELVNTDKFEQLLGSIFILEGDFAELTLLPSDDLSARQHEQEDEKIRSYVETLTEEQLRELDKELEDVKRWQTEPNSPEELATLPELSLDCLEPEPMLFPTEEDEVSGIRLLRHPVDTNGIVYFALYFRMTDFTLDEFASLSLLPELFGELPTEKYSVAELQRLNKSYIGNMSVTLNSFSEFYNIKSCTPYLIINAGVLEENLDVACELICEMLTKTDFSDKERIRDIITQLDVANREFAVSAGHSLAAMEARAGYSSKGAFKEAISGLTAIRRIRELGSEFDNRFEELTKLFGRAVSGFGRRSLIMSVTTKEKADISKIAELLPEGRDCPEKVEFKTDIPVKLGIKIPAPVSYAVKGYHPALSGRGIDGGLRVAANVISLSYLWNQVRVLGGAYGAGLAVAGNEGIFCYSYRDPSPEASLKAFSEIDGFIDEFVASDEKLDKYIISTIASANPLLDPMSVGITADSFRLAKTTDERRIKTYREMLSSTKETLLGQKDIMSGLGENGTICVVGGEEALSHCTDLTIVEL